jgi:hypothetical protein
VLHVSLEVIYGINHKLVETLINQSVLGFFK